jgi:hypothetical protein
VELIFITPTLVLRAQAVFGWGICLYRDGVRELHIFCGGFGMIRIPGPDMDDVIEQFIRVGLATPATRAEMFCPPPVDLVALRLDHP